MSIESAGPDGSRKIKKYDVRFAASDSTPERITAVVTYPVTQEIIELGTPEQVQRRIQEGKWPSRVAMGVSIAAGLATSVTGMDSILYSHNDISGIALNTAEVFSGMAAISYTGYYWMRKELFRNAVAKAWKEKIRKKTSS